MEQTENRMSLQSQYDHHCQVIDETTWPRNEKRKVKKAILNVLKRDGKVDFNYLPPSYRWNLCAARLKQGDFTNWDGWEFRSDWAVTFRGLNGFETKVKKWDGTPVNHLIVIGEQGLGDEILFLSALPELIVRLGHDAIEVQTYPRLQKIVERSFRVKTSPRKTLGQITEGDALVALGDLFPWYRRDKSHFPRKPYFKPDPEKVEKWKRVLQKLGDGPKVGVAWFSRHGHINPQSLMTEDAIYIDLQYRVPGVPEYPGLIQLEIDNREDTEEQFALVAALDYVKSVTQTLVHVAGSLGKPCEAVIPPRNGEANWYLWYHEVGGEKDTWTSLVYPSVTYRRAV